MSQPTPTELLARARELATTFAGRASDTEQSRRLPDETIRDLIESGLLRILQPARYGGFEMDMETFIRAVAEVSRGDVSTGWICAIFGIHNWWLGYVDPQLQDEMWGEDSHRLFADSFAPVGNAERQAKGYRLSGRWKFLSGVEWSDYVAVAAMAPGEAGGEPEYVMFFLPQSDYRIEDEWHVVGLRGTASNAVVVEGAYVPEHRVFPLGRVLVTGKASGQNVNPGPLYRLPFMVAAGAALAAPVVGAARGAVHQFQQRVQQRVPLFSNKPQKEMGSAQVALAECSTRLDALETLMLRYANEAMEMGRSHRLPSERERAQFFAWRGFLVRRAIRVVDRIFELSGGQSIFDTHPIQRIWRDVHAAGQHVALNYESAMEAFGRVLVGRPSGTVL